MIGIRVSHFSIEQGEYIAPEKVQNVYLRSPFIAQVFVHGDSFKVSLRFPTLCQRNVKTQLYFYVRLCFQSTLIRLENGACGKRYS